MITVMCETCGMAITVNDDPVGELFKADFIERHKEHGKRNRRHMATNSTGGDDMADLEQLRGKLKYAQERLDAANEAMCVAERKGDDAHELGGGILGFGASGNQRAARQVRSALNSSYRAWKEASERIDKWQYRVKSLQRRIAEVERPRLTRDDVLGAVAIHDGTSWRRVVRVNQKSVSVVNAHVADWEPDRIPFDKITDFRRAA